MNRTVWLIGIGALAVLAVGLTGCNRHEGRDWPEADGTKVLNGGVVAKPGPEEPVAPPPGGDVTPGRTELIGRLSDHQKQRIISESLLSLQRVIVSSAEKATLSGGAEAATTTADALTSRLAELGFMVIQTTEQLEFSPTEQQQDRFGRQNDCNLVFLAKGGATQIDKFGNFYSFQADLQGKVLNLTTHQIIASKTVSVRGKRALSDSEAAQSALTAAAGDLATYLTDEVARKWEATSLIKSELIATNMDTLAMADDLRVGLQKRAGIYYVSLDRWDETSQVARYEILCRFDVQRFLAAYVDELRRGNVKVQSIQQRGEAITAERKNLG